MEQAKTVAVIGGRDRRHHGGISHRAGFDVELVCKHADRAAEISGRGVHITGVRGDMVVPMKAVAEIEQLTGKKDVLLIVTKAYDMPDAARRALPFLKPNSFVVSMQNGICVEALAEVVGAERTVGCVVGWGSTMLPDGSLNMTSEGEFVIGGYLPGKDVTPLKAMLDCVIQTRISDNVTDLYQMIIPRSRRWAFKRAVRGQILDPESGTYSSPSSAKRKRGRSDGYPRPPTAAGGLLPPDGRNRAWADFGAT